MKEFFKLAALMVALVVPAAAFAQGKIAVVNDLQSVMNTKAAQERFKQWQQEPSIKANAEEYEALAKKFQASRERLIKDSAIMGEEQKKQMLREQQELGSDIEHIQRKLKAAEQDFFKVLMKEFNPKYSQAINELIKEEGIGLIIPQQATVYVDSSYNITAKITEKLNQMQ